MTVIVADVAKQFTKKELHAIATELELEIALGINSKDLVAAIIANVEAEGVPEIDECSDLLAELLITTEYIDEEGNLLEDDADGDDKEADAGLAEEDIVKPECFGFQDARDPACGMCKVEALCIKERTSTRPDCFGILYKAHDPECQICLECAECKGVIK